MQTPRMHQGLLTALQPPVPLQMPPDRQTLQVQLLLQMFHRRERPAGPHPQTQGVETPQDPHLPVLRQELHPGDVPGQAHAETQRQTGKEIIRNPHFRRSFRRKQQPGNTWRKRGQ